MHGPADGGGRGAARLVDYVNGCCRSRDRWRCAWARIIPPTGTVSADRTGSVVFLEKPEGGIERVDAARFARAIDCLHRSLRPVVLMSCNTATRSPTDPRFGFAPALLGAAFTHAFYEELWTSGEIDKDHTGGAWAPGPATSIPARQRSTTQRHGRGHSTVAHESRAARAPR